MMNVQSDGRSHVSYQITQLVEEQGSTMADQATKDAAARDRMVSHMNADHHDSVSRSPCAPRVEIVY